MRNHTLYFFVSRLNPSIASFQKKLKKFILHYIDNLQSKYMSGIIFADDFSVVYDYYITQVCLMVNGGELVIWRLGVEMLQS